MQSLPTAPFLGLPLALCGADELVAWLLDRASVADRPTRVAYLNAATVNLAFDAPEFARTLSRFDCLYADGAGVAWGASRLGLAGSRRATAADFIESFLAGCAERRLSLALVGGLPGEAERCGERFRRIRPGIEIVLARDGYFSSEREPALADELRQADPRVVLAGMGSPRQEDWVERRSVEDDARLWWCVGGLFEYFGADRPRAPLWMREHGLEWLYRLRLEPRRLWRRYLLGNPLFVYRVLRGRSCTTQRPPTSG